MTQGHQLFRSSTINCTAHCQASDAHFGRAMAERDLARYHQSGPDRSTSFLIDALTGAGLRGAHLLDIGGGIGVIHHELMGEAVARATHVEASSAYLEATRSEDERRGWSDRVEYLAGDAAELAGRLPQADAVTLDRVICCYPAWRPLVAETARAALRFYAFSVPHDRWYVRLAGGFENLVRRLKRNPFRTFVHPVAEIDRLLTELGFRVQVINATAIWHIALYQRD